MKPFSSEYVNKYGEEWVFEYHPTSAISLVRGSDVDWTNYPVVEGYALGLILTDDE